MLDFSMTVGGRQVTARETFAVINPATGQVIAEVPFATEGEVDRAVRAAHAARARVHGRPELELAVVGVTIWVALKAPTLP